MTKFIFITGGVVSSIGKGILAASLGRLLKTCSLKINIQKLDPYINVDAGTMNPYQHGEVFVTDDGAETDLDLGHYERFINESLSRDNNITTGKVYGAVISKERHGDYLGDTVRVIPHVTDQIKHCILKSAKDSKADISIVEIGGTVGDIEGLPFLEAIRQMKVDLGHQNVLYIHVTLIPHLGAAKELKTKPTQHSVKELRSIGIQPDIIVCRTSQGLTRDMVEKIALYCDVPAENVIESRDVDCIYEIPLILAKNNLEKTILKHFNLLGARVNLAKWITINNVIKKSSRIIKIALVGKYIELKDAYLSITEALNHGGIANKVKIEIIKIDAETLAKEGAKKFLSKADGVLVPGGFGTRGIEGKIKAIEYARTNKVPFLGICYGMQWAVVEFARNVLKTKDANSTEADKNTKNPVISLLTEQKSITDMGGTMRLGAYTCKIKKGTSAYKAYKKEVIEERHRHRYEFNNFFKEKLEKAGLIISGINPKRNLVEIIEIKNHPWFTAVQFHPEFKSRPNKPHPLFKDFIKAACTRAEKTNKE
ncbi:MAG: CTP synthase [Armatimonadota bacterium]